MSHVFWQCARWCQPSEWILDRIYFGCCFRIWPFAAAFSTFVCARNLMRASTPIAGELTLHASFRGVSLQMFRFPALSLYLCACLRAYVKSHQSRICTHSHTFTSDAIWKRKKGNQNKRIHCEQSWQWTLAADTTKTTTISRCHRSTIWIVCPIRIMLAHCIALNKKIDCHFLTLVWQHQKW